MVYINGKVFDDFPECCYACHFFSDCGQDQQRGWCTLFEKRKNKYDALSNRCRKIFDKAKTFADGSELVIVQNIH